MIESERILNILYNNYLKECAENKYKIPDLQNRLKTMISFHEHNKVKRRESVNNYKNNYLYNLKLPSTFFLRFLGNHLELLMTLPEELEDLDVICYIDQIPYTYALIVQLILIVQIIQIILFLMKVGNEFHP